MSPRNLLQLFVRAGKAWSDDYAPSMGAAISYYTVFSLAPLLVIVIAVAGAVFGREAVTGQIVAQIRGLVGDQGATVVQNVVAASSDTHKGLVAGIISAVVLVIGATSVFTELQSALDRIWHVPASQKPQGVWNILRSRLLSFGVILGLVFLLMVSLVVSAGLSAVGDWAGVAIPGGTVLLQLLNHAVSLGVATVLFAFIFKVLPSTTIAWRDVWVGAFTTAVLFEIGKFLIGLYLGKSSTTQAFAAAGSLVVLIAWVYYAAQIFLMGAEFTKVYAHEHGSRKGVQDAAAGAPVLTKSQRDDPAKEHPKELAMQHENHDAKARDEQHASGHDKHHAPALPAVARLQETRQRLEVEVPPKAVKMKKAAKGASAAAAGIAAVALVAVQLIRRHRKSAAAKPAHVLARGASSVREHAKAIGSRASARANALGQHASAIVAKRAPVLRKRGILSFGR